MAKKKVNSRDKGKRGELEVVKLIKRHGFEARRSQQFKGTKDSADILAPEVPFHIEVKWRQQLNVDAVLQQAHDEAPPGVPGCVFFRRNGERWKVAIDADDFMRLLKKDS